MNPDGRTEWTDGRTDDAKTISLRLRRGITTVGKVGELNVRTYVLVNFVSPSRPVSFYAFSLGHQMFEAKTSFC